MNCWSCLPAILPLVVFFSPLLPWNNDRKIMIPAQFIAQFPDAVVALFIVMVFVMIDVVGSTENDVVMDMTFINMCGDNIRIFVHGK